MSYELRECNLCVMNVYIEKALIINAIMRAFDRVIYFYIRFKIKLGNSPITRLKIVAITATTV
jgi:hypothetical protein